MDADHGSSRLSGRLPGRPARRERGFRADAALTVAIHGGLVRSRDHVAVWKRLHGFGHFHGGIGSARDRARHGASAPHPHRHPPGPPGPMRPAPRPGGGPCASTVTAAHNPRTITLFFIRQPPGISTTHTVLPRHGQKFHSSAIIYAMSGTRWPLLAALAVAAMAFSGCAHKKRVQAPAPPPAVRPGYTETGVASWYGIRTTGARRPTAKSTTWKRWWRRTARCHSIPGCEW